MKNVSFIFAIFLIAFSAFGCDGDSSQDNPIETKAYGIVSGTDGLLVCTSTNGTTWSQMDVPGDLSEADFGGVAFSPGEPDKVWVVSSEPPAIMTSTDGGKTWKTYEGELYDCIPDRVEVADTETAWISCDSGDSNQPSALKTEDGGKTWILQEAGSPLPENAIVLQGLSVVNTKVAWMSGGYGPSSNSSGLVLRTVDGGATWEAKVKPDGGDDQIPSDQTGQAVAATSADEAWVVTGQSTTQGGSVYHTTDGGDTWTMQADTPVGRNADLNDIRIVEGVIWVASDFGTALRSADGGDTWEKFDTRASGYNMGVAALNGTTAWAVSSGYGNAGDIVNTTDSGKTWNKQPYPEKTDYQNLSDVAFEKAL